MFFLIILTYNKFTLNQHFNVLNYILCTSAYVLVSICYKSQDHRMYKTPWRWSYKWLCVKFPGQSK